mmetsp:Transcript_13445/g.31615  ORF Transcript_13445/g.31615 Transcript_13445/m.31615 type:complete len:207 (+) Transcript_13445:285-905(+)
MCQGSNGESAWCINITPHARSATWVHGVQHARKPLPLVLDLYPIANLRLPSTCNVHSAGECLKSSLRRPGGDQHAFPAFYMRKQNCGLCSTTTTRRRQLTRFKLPLGRQALCSGRANEALCLGRLEEGKDLLLALDWHRELQFPARVSPDRPLSNPLHKNSTPTNWHLKTYIQNFRVGEVDVFSYPLQEVSQFACTVLFSCQCRCR